MRTQDGIDVDAHYSQWLERFNDPLKVKKWALVDRNSKPESLCLLLMLKAAPRQRALEACEDGDFLFEVENHELIAMACDILDKLDPVTNEQLLEKIRRLVDRA